MKVIQTGNRFITYEDLKVFEKLPAQAYIVRCNPMTGFYLEKSSDITVSEEKIYGIHDEKVNKVLKSFDLFNRSLGIILSGNKGIGKSLFAKMLAIKGIEKGLPLILVNEFTPGIASFLASIEQEVMVLFDEFDKTFGNIKVSENEADPQAGLLTLFDGVTQGKKLFIITCNEIRNLNDYLINRPGRFHYHFRFDYPSAEEVKEYLEDKLKKEYYNEINKVIAFSRKIQLNYDCLRSIAFELNLGNSFEESIKDLNIINVQSEKYNVTLLYEDGYRLTSYGYRLDLFNMEDSEMVRLFDKGNHIMDVNFSPSDIIMDMKTGKSMIPAEKLHMDYLFDYYDSDDPEYKTIEKLKETKALYLTIERCLDKSLHYLV